MSIPRTPTRECARVVICPGAPARRRRPARLASVRRSLSSVMDRVSDSFESLQMDDEEPALSVEEQELDRRFNDAISSFFEP